MTEAEAYRRWHAQDKARQRYIHELRSIGARIDALAAKLAADKAEEHERRVRDLVATLKDDRAFVRTLRAFTGHTPRGWLVACGCDGRMRGLLRKHGWDTLKEVISRVKYELMWYKRVNNTTPRGLARIGGL